MSTFRKIAVAAVVLNVLGGQPVDVKPGTYHLRVPCDSMKAGSFVDITVTIDDNSKTRLRLEECGVEVDNR
ncbi:MAG: hypothetical protein JF619_07515 [Massilia sp.]|nr:hypothetical protein [Massilia sp.]